MSPHHYVRPPSHFSWQCHWILHPRRSESSDPAGPYAIVEVMFERASWEPSIARAPDGSLVLMFFGNLSSPPPPGSEACQIPSFEYNLTTTNTYVTVSPTGDAAGPWTTPVEVRGMQNNASRLGKATDPYHWACASGNPSPAYHPNGTLFAAMRHNPCWKGTKTREHIGLWKAADGPFGNWTRVNAEPLYGWGHGGGSAIDCTDTNGCPSHEDPHLWIDSRGFHLLTHDQGNHEIHSRRGAYGWSVDGHTWVLETPLERQDGHGLSNSSAWPMNLKWTNGTSSPLVCAALILDIVR